MQSSTRLRFNVGGHHHETTFETVRRFPDTLLGRLFSESNLNANPPVPDKNGEYFFDRDGDLFVVVIGFYRNGGRVLLPRVWDRCAPEAMVRSMERVPYSPLLSFFSTEAELIYFQIPFRKDLFKPIESTKDPPSSENPKVHAAGECTNVVASKTINADRAGNLSLEKLAKSLPAVKRYTTDVLEEGAAVGRDMMKKFGDLIVRAGWAGIEAAVNEIRYNRKCVYNGWSSWVEFKILVKSGGKLSAITLVIGNGALRQDLPAESITSEAGSDNDLDWGELVRFLTLKKLNTSERLLDLLRQLELKRVRENFVNALAHAMTTTEYFHGGTIRLCTDNWGASEEAVYDVEIRLSYN
ncbi:BTB/POZ protein [Jimgerdemannia flammicorona]|uniref:BTB/POZ protein n=1 Tax=Jimgerdemannia flammicorona TaxID=994334 RepID=A0A433D523_9FUNG|nr:BTB/POZ protein [Jimgerdemannia flammicorona]